MIERVGYGGYQLGCDECDTVAEPGFANTKEARAWARDHGWKNVRERGEWYDYCPECAIEAGFTPPPYGERVEKEEPPAPKPLTKEEALLSEEYAKAMKKFMKPDIWRGAKKQKQPTVEPPQKEEAPLPFPFGGEEAEADKAQQKTARTAQSKARRSSRKEEEGEAGGYGRPDTDDELAAALERIRNAGRKQA